MFSDSTVESVAGVGTGIVSVALFNPYDQALYLHVVNHRDFFDRRNFVQPYAGVSSAVVSRVINSGLYFSMIDYYKAKFTNLLCSSSSSSSSDENNSNSNSNNSKNENENKNNSKNENSFLINSLSGIAVGINTSIILSPISAVKYHSWNTPGRLLREEAERMWKHGGVKPFTAGLFATIIRDSIFSVLYMNLRPPKPKETKLVVSSENNSNNNKNNSNSSSSYFSSSSETLSIETHMKYFLTNTAVVAASTIASGPFNYCRNLQYHTSSNNLGKQLSILQCFKHLAKKLDHHHHGAIAKIKFVQHQFSIGYGTMRVAIGITLGREIYEFLVPRMKKTNESLKR